MHRDGQSKKKKKYSVQANKTYAYYVIIFLRSYVLNVSILIICSRVLNSSNGFKGWKQQKKIKNFQQDNKLYNEIKISYDTLVWYIFVQINL